MTPTQRTEIETALDAMAIELQAHGLMRHPISGLYLRAIRHVREVPHNTRRVRSDFNDRRHGPQMTMKEVV